MPTYRAYLLNAAGKITWGDWLDATDEQDAEAKAHALCSEGTPVVELWQGARLVAQLPCDESAEPVHSAS